MYKEEFERWLAYDLEDPDLLPELQLEVTVRARLDHAPDRKEV